MDLYKHQEDLIRLNPPRWLLAWGTGTAKSRTAIELAKKNVTSCLIICPKALKENWHRETIKWGKGRAITWRIVSKEEFKKLWNELPGYEGVILDEFHYFGNSASQLSKDLSSYIKKNKVVYRWGLTATPYLSTPWNIHALSTHLGHKWNWMAFKRKFFYEVQMGRRLVPMPRPGMEGEIAKLVGEIGNTVKLEDVADLPEQSFETKFLSLTKTQEKEIKGIDEINPIVKFTRQHMLENGAVNSNEYEDSRMIEDNSKIEVIEEICREHKKVAIFCRYNVQIDLYEKQLRKIGRPIFVIRGDTANRDAVVRESESSDGSIVLINSACSEGYELPSVGIIVFASLSFSLKDYIQSIGRFSRINRLKKNHYIHLVSGEVDEAVYKAIMRKEDFHLEIFANQHEK